MRIIYEDSYKVSGPERYFNLFVEWMRRIQYDYIEVWYRRGVELCRAGISAAKRIGKHSRT